MATSSTSSSPPTSSSSLATSPYPYAFAPDIIRAHQKDAYFQGLLTNQLTDLHRRLLGARSAHSWSTESRTLADLIYLCLTTLLGNRTLGEEYCGLVQVESSSSPLHPDQGRRLPSIQRRAAYIAGSILLPYGLARLLPVIRARLRARLERNLARAEAHAQSTKPSNLKGGSKPPTQTWRYKAQAYLLANLSTLTSPAPVHALSLALFYFSGSYYELAKRLTGLRYIFTSRAQTGDASTGEPGADRAGYEVLGVLLVVQMSVQAYLHIRSTLSSFSTFSQQAASRERSAAGGGGSVHVSLDEHAYSANNAVLLTEMGTPGTSGSQTTRVDIAAVTHTPAPPASPSSNGVRYDLTDEDAMRWIKGVQQRKCTLCLEELKDPAATQCGHVFCWACIGDWVREKPECPLCRREAMVQHILPLRAF
ncbi:Pex12 amino terminal region-domain-containing protein [Xylaria bambusicola]|uniref:Pex12 amino terminal region-domain-containing protein n=1 Tax=Xylaria bambusicola TaxID=326684 RepID=UPI002007F0CA|nr:Pex12 amino terminal region-domain-containing protein [Xylaria bambusicola]KAI0512552.1 Pex12 amino terminal region-domain-containing protein [Xylaria bambusicola]